MSLIDKYAAKLTKVVKDTLLLAQKRQVKCEVFANITWGKLANIRMQKIDTLEFNNTTTLSITIYKNQQKGNVNLTTLDQHAITQAIDKALNIAKFTEPDPYAGLADPNLIIKKFIDLDLYHPYEITPELAIETAKKCEQAAFNYHPSISNSDGVMFNYENNIIALGNSSDFITTQAETTFSLSCNVIAEHHGAMQRDGDFTVARNFKDLIDPEIIGENAAAYTHQRIGAVKIPTCKTKVLFTPPIAAQLFRYFIAAISGSNLANKSSFLLNKINQQIFPDFIQIIDHPFITKGLKSSCYDGDGIATSKQAVVSNGILNTYLLSNYFAKKLGSRPTGHANGIHNLLVNNQELNFNSPTIELPKSKAITHAEIWQQRSDLIKTMGTGLIVTETIGHGVNLVTGDYSKGAFGFWVENGEISYPVHEITIASNLIEMFANIMIIGNDYDYQNNIITGSLLIDNITIGGSQVAKS